MISATLRDFSSLVVPPGSRAGELTRGCRLDADNAGGVSFVQSSMILCSSHLSAVSSSPFFSSLPRSVFPCPRLSSGCSAFPFRVPLLRSSRFAFSTSLLCLAIFLLAQRDELNRPNGSCKRSRTIVLSVFSLPIFFEKLDQKWTIVGFAIGFRAENNTR